MKPMTALPTPPPKRRHFPVKRTLLVALLIVVYLAVVFLQPLDDLPPVHASGTLTITTPASHLPWPAYGEAAMGPSTGPVVATHGTQVPMATASTIKILTALCVLQKHPLQPGESGPTITLNSHDVDLYHQYVAEDGSVVAVVSGEQLSEKQALEAMLLPSANNIADTLAEWSFGSLSAYQTYATNYAAKLGMTDTHVGTDASGFSPTSTSTAHDLVLLGGAAMQNATLAAIVGQKSAVIPEVGTVRNTDSLLGVNNIVGLKTGNNDQDRGVFLGAATTTVSGKSATVVTAILGAPDLNQVLQDSNDLLTASKTTFTETTLINAGEVIGNYRLPGGSTVQAVAGTDLTTTLLQGDTAKVHFMLDTITYSAKAGQRVGTLKADATQFGPAETAPIVLKQAPQKPSLGYRLLHP